mmetsp:Transcript_11479/g.36468  ORF Transcript_11479/g.36468 Transcript_11479/m.36468 type:complete len:96 (+) Transcript_11479:664-951(+)
MLPLQPRGLARLSYCAPHFVVHSHRRPESVLLHATPAHDLARLSVRPCLRDAPKKKRRLCAATALLVASTPLSHSRPPISRDTGVPEALCVLPQL